MNRAYEDESDCGRVHDFGLAPELSAIDSQLRSLRPQRSASGLAEMLFAAGRASVMAEVIPQHAAAKYVVRKNSRRSAFLDGIASGVAATLFATGILFMSLRSAETQTIVNDPEHDSGNESSGDSGDSLDEPSVQPMASLPLWIPAPSIETVDLSAVSLAARQQWHSASASIATFKVSGPQLTSSLPASRTRAGLIRAMLREEVF
jgi:hypothetical protein